MNSSPRSPLEQFACSLARGAALELYLTPKPGLVDLLDNGSHPDLSLATMEASVDLLHGYLAELALSLAGGGEFAEQRAMGRAAERAMLERFGTNTHKGYIFLSGLLLCARSHAPGPGEEGLRSAVRELAERFFATDEGGESNGCRVRQRFQAGGIVREACDGLPALFETALPVYRATLADGGDCQRASFAMLARLMQVVDDTTSLHRCGPRGLARLRRDGALLERLVAGGDDFRPFLSRLNREYVAMNLTMGGVADLLALAFGCLAAEGGGDLSPHFITTSLTTAPSESLPLFRDTATS